MAESKHSTTWTDATTPSDLLSLPFDHLEHVTDQYEMALLSLYKRNWNLLKIFFMHFFIYAPVIPLSFFTPPDRFGKVDYGKHLLETLLSLLIFFGGLWVFLKVTHYTDLFHMLAGIFSVSLFVLYVVFAQNTFRPWWIAHKHLQIYRKQKKSPAH